MTACYSSVLETDTELAAVRQCQIKCIRQQGGSSHQNCYVHLEDVIHITNVTSQEVQIGSIRVSL